MKQNNITILENTNTGDIIKFEEFDIVDTDGDISHEEFMKELAELAEINEDE